MPKTHAAQPAMPHCEIWGYCQSTAKVQAYVLQNLRVCRASLAGCCARHLGRAPMLLNNSRKAMQACYRLILADSRSVGFPLSPHARCMSPPPPPFSSSPQARPRVGPTRAATWLLALVKAAQGDLEALCLVPYKRPPKGAVFKTPRPPPPPKHPPPFRPVGTTLLMFVTFGTRQQPAAARPCGDSIFVSPSPFQVGP